MKLFVANICQCIKVMAKICTQQIIKIKKIISKETHEHYT